MAALIDYPEDDEIVAAVREHGSVLRAAVVFDLNQSTLDRRVTDRGLRDRCNAARKEFRTAQLEAAKPPPAKKPDKPGVTRDGDKAKLISPPSPKLQDIPTLMKHWGLDPDEWEVDPKGIKINTWDALTSDKATGDNRIVRMHQLTVYARLKVELRLIQPAVHVPAVVRPRPVKRSRTKPRVTVVEGDHQAPYFDTDLDAAVTGFVQDLQPAKHGFLGDTIDLSTISKYADHPATTDATPQVCLDEGYGILRRRAEAAPNTERWKLKGNHDWRLEGEQLLRSERMYGLKPAHIEGTTSWRPTRCATCCIWTRSGSSSSSTRSDGSTARWRSSPARTAWSPATGL
jgi:hypothetical protein